LSGQKLNNADQSISEANLTPKHLELTNELRNTYSQTQTEREFISLARKKQKLRFSKGDVPKHLIILTSLGTFSLCLH
jgi:hypothetical protein